MVVDCRHIRTNSGTRTLKTRVLKNSPRSLDDDFVIPIGQESFFDQQQWQGGQQQWNNPKSGDQQQGWTQNQQWTPKGKKQGGKQNWNQKGQWNWRARVVITAHSFMVSPVYVEQPGTLFL